MFQAKRSKQNRIFWAIISVMVIFSMVIWTIGALF